MQNGLKVQGTDKGSEIYLSSIYIHSVCVCVSFIYNFKSHVDFLSTSSRFCVSTDKFRRHLLNELVRTLLILSPLGFCCFPLLWVLINSIDIFGSSLFPVVGSTWPWCSGQGIGLPYQVVETWQPYLSGGLNRGSKKITPTHKYSIMGLERRGFYLTTT